MHDEDRRNTIVEQSAEPQAGEPIPPRVLASGLEARIENEAAESFIDPLRRVERAGWGGTVLECRLNRAVLAEGPIRQVQTEVGAIETPEVRFTSLGCTVSIPAGVTAVIGGGLGAGDGERCLLLVTPRIVGGR